MLMENLPPINPKDERQQFAHKPELVLAYRGLEITVSAGFMTRAQAEDMLAAWDSGEAPPSDLHDQVEGGGDVAA